jgi:hypothetical protein
MKWGKSQERIFMRAGIRCWGVLTVTTVPNRNLRRVKKTSSVIITPWPLALRKSCERMVMRTSSRGKTVGEASEAG